jgi:hypothetical protein
MSHRTERHDQPVMIVSGVDGVEITPLTHATLIAMIRVWLADLSPEMDRDHHRDLRLMGEAAIALIEVDESTGLSIEQFYGGVKEMVDRVAAYTFDRTGAGISCTMHWPTH